MNFGLTTFLRSFLSPTKTYLLLIGLILGLVFFAYVKISNWWNSNNIESFKTQISNQKTEIDSMKKAILETQQTVAIMEEQRKRDEARTVEFRKQKNIIRDKTSQGVDQIMKTPQTEDGKIAPVLANTLIKIKSQRDGVTP